MERTRTPFGQNMGQVRHATNLLKDRIVQRDRLMLTAEEYLDLFVEPSLHKAWLLVSASAASLVSEYSTNLNVELPGRALIELHVSIFTRGKQKLLMPSPMKFRDDNLELFTKVTSWVKERWRVGHEWGVVRKVLDKLDTLLNSPGQVRYYFPAILTIFEANKDAFTTAFVEKFALPTSRNIPALPVELRDAIRRASATVTAAALLSDEKLETPPGAAEISFSPSAARQARDPVGMVDVL